MVAAGWSTPAPRPGRSVPLPAWSSRRRPPLLFPRRRTAPIHCTRRLLYLVGGSELNVGDLEYRATHTTVVSAVERDVGSDASCRSCMRRGVLNPLNDCSNPGSSSPCPWSSLPNVDSSTSSCWRCHRKSSGMAKEAVCGTCSAPTSLADVPTVRACAYLAPPPKPRAQHLNPHQRAASCNIQGLFLRTSERQILAPSRNTRDRTTRRRCPLELTTSMPASVSAYTRPLSSMARPSALETGGSVAGMERSRPT